MTKVIAVSGASGSGKSTFAAALARLLTERGSRVKVLPADDFFKPELPTLVSPADGETYPDWNHPDSVDMPAYADAIEAARDSGECDYVLIEGVTIYCDKRVRSLADVKVYIDASIEMRIYRRIARNAAAGQTIEFIGGYYLKCARYRERAFSLPSAEHADLRVDNEWGFDIEAEAERILALLGH